MNHIDLFSGIGGFALAVDSVWNNVDHTFCEIDPFCHAILRKHWKGCEIYGDIRTLTNTNRNGLQEPETKLETGGDRQFSETSTNAEGGQSRVKETGNGRKDIGRGSKECFIFTGGFPCQPFSQAGKRRGTADNRFLWPEMLRVIREFQPTWVIAENVRGLLTIEQGVVFEQVCASLENEGYEVQPFIIPAVAVNAPHRRDRVWVLAHSVDRGLQRRWGKAVGKVERSGENQETPLLFSTAFEKSNWQRNWLEVATKLCGVDDGLPGQMDGVTITKARHRVERLKALGNAIVPQVAIEIMRAIKQGETRRVYA